MARRPRCRPTAGTGSLGASAEIEPVQLDSPALFDTGAWTWVRDRRFPELAAWFNAQVAAGLVLVCDLVVLELVRLTPNEARARAVAERLDAFEFVPMPAEAWTRARELQIALADDGDHRRVPRSTF
jgi:predicted nucleic acid-binding protein